MRLEIKFSDWSFKLSGLFRRLAVFLIPRSIRRLLIRTLVLKVYPYPAFCSTDRKIEKICKEICNPTTFYIEVGANDGIQQSNTYFLEKRYKAKGLLIEPSPISYIELIRNRSKNNHFRCCALVPFDYPEKYVEMVYSDQSSVSHINNDTDLINNEIEFLANQRNFLRKGETNFKFFSPAILLNNILIEIKAPELIDFFSLDVEGNELNVLKGVDFQKYTFKFILVECRNVDRMDAFLSPLGYERLTTFYHIESVDNCVDALYRFK
jgi:FkbM family methyltransferase